MSGLGKDKRFKMKLILQAGKFDQIKRNSKDYRFNIAWKVESHNCLNSINVWNWGSCTPQINDAFVMKSMNKKFITSI